MMTMMMMVMLMMMMIRRMMLMNILCIDGSNDQVKKICSVTICTMPVFWMIMMMKAVMMTNMANRHDFSEEEDCN